MTTNTMAAASKLLSRLGINHDEETVHGIEYVITRGTGEASGPHVGFAYLATEIAALDAERVADYTDFCAAVSPNDDRDVAIWLAARDHRILTNGLCTPVLSDEEYTLIREAVESL